MFVDFAFFDFDFTLVMTYEHETQNMQMHLISKSSCIHPQINKIRLNISKKHNILIFCGQHTLQ